MSYLQFVPIDRHAKDGNCHLLEAEDGSKHCARWADGHWVYSSTAKVQVAITSYCARLQRPEIGASA